MNQIIRIEESQVSAEVLALTEARPYVADFADQGDDQARARSGKVLALIDAVLLARSRMP